MSFTQTQIDAFFTSVESLLDVTYDIGQGVLDQTFVVVDRAVDSVKNFVADVKDEMNDRAQRAAGVDEETYPDAHTMLNTVINTADRQFGVRGHGWRDFNFKSDHELKNLKKFYKQAVENDHLSD